MLLGVSHSDYWSADPSTIVRFCELASDKMKNDNENALTIAYLNARLNAIGFNDVKKFPKSVDDFLGKKEQTDLDHALFLLSLPIEEDK